MLHIHLAPFISLLQMTKWLLDQSISVQRTFSFNGCSITNKTRGPAHELMTSMTLLCTFANCNPHLTNLLKPFVPFKPNHCSLWTPGILVSGFFIQSVIHSHKHLTWFLCHQESLYSICVSASPQTSRGRMKKCTYREFLPASERGLLPQRLRTTCSSSKSTYSSTS